MAPGEAPVGELAGELPAALDATDEGCDSTWAGAVDGAAVAAGGSLPREPDPGPGAGGGSTASTDALGCDRTVGRAVGVTVATGPTTVTVGPATEGWLPFSVAAAKLTGHEPAGRGPTLPLQVPPVAVPVTRASGTTRPATLAVTDVAAFPLSDWYVTPRTKVDPSAVGVAVGATSWLGGAADAADGAPASAARVARTTRSRRPISPNHLPLDGARAARRGRPGGQLAQTRR
jgi:hypothetical protein